MLVNEDLARLYVKFDPHPTAEAVAEFHLHVPHVIQNAMMSGLLDLAFADATRTPNAFYWQQASAFGPYTNPFGREERAGTTAYLRLTSTDTAAPVLESQTVSGASLVLSYDEALDESSEPAARQFDVRVTPPGGTAARRNVRAVEISGNTVTLTLATPVFRAQAVTVKYTVPASNPVQDLARNDAAAIDPAVSVSNASGGNRAPWFDGVARRPPGGATREVADNAPAGSPVGAPMTATDLNGDPLTYRITRFERTIMDGDGNIISTQSLEWMSSAYFTIDKDTGQIRTKSGVDYNYGKRRTYFVEVEVTDDQGALGRTDVCIQLLRGPDSTPTLGLAPLRAEFQQVPAGHDEETAVSMQIALDRALSTSGEGVRHSLAITNGKLTETHQIDGRSHLWGITVEPASDEDVTVRLNASADCADPKKTMCTSDGRRLEEAVEIMVPGPTPATTVTSASITNRPGVNGT